jgi:hypothetical protein
MLCNLQHFGGKGACWSLKWRLGWMTSESIIHIDLHNLNNKLVSAWLKHFCCTNEPRAYMDSQDSSRYGLGEATTFPLIVFFVISHRSYIQMSFCPENLGLSKFWRAITSCAYFWLRWSCSPCRKLSTICCTPPACTYFKAILWQRCLIVCKSDCKLVAFGNHMTNITNTEEVHNVKLT